MIYFIRKTEKRIHRLHKARNPMDESRSPGLRIDREDSLRLEFHGQATLAGNSIAREDGMSQGGYGMRSRLARIAAAIFAVALASCASSRSPVAERQPGAIPAPAIVKPGARPEASASYVPARIRIGLLGADERVDPEECAFGVTVSSDELSYVVYIRSGDGAGRILTSAGDIDGADELLVLYKDSAIPAGRYQQGREEYVFVGDHRGGPYALCPYYEHWDNAIQARREGSRWAYWYAREWGEFYLASSLAPDIGPYRDRGTKPDFMLRKDFFILRLPDGSYLLDGKPLATDKVYTDGDSLSSAAGDVFACAIKKADGEYLYVQGATLKGPFQAVENITVTEEGWAAIGRYPDGRARLVSDSGDAYPIPAGAVDHLSKGGADSWALVFKRDNAYVLWSPEGGEEEPVLAQAGSCAFFSDPKRKHTLARYCVEGEPYKYYLRELGTSFGPYLYANANSLQEPVVTAEGWISPFVQFKAKIGCFYRFGDKVNFIQGGDWEGYLEPVASDGKDLAFAISGSVFDETGNYDRLGDYGETDDNGDTGAWVYWKGARMGPFGDVMGLAVRDGDLLAAVHGQEGRSLLLRNGYTELSFQASGQFLISKDGSSNLFRENLEDYSIIYVKGKEAATGLFLACGETRVEGVPHWYWLSQEGRELFITLYRIP
jgi:hypothetical protein